MLNDVLKKQLKIITKLVIKKYQPQIIAITGSVGKTSAREAIACVLSSKFNVRRNPNNYNNEIGLPLTILGEDAKGKDLLGWLIIFFRAYRTLVWRDKNFPKFIILELGVDRPGDMAYLTSIVTPDVAVVTSIGQAHLEYFENEENLAKEKSVLIKSLRPKGYAVLNYDDERVRKMEKYTKARIITYGINDKADVKALEITFTYEKNKTNSELNGLAFKLKYQGSFVPVHLPSSIGQPAVYASLAAASVGLIYGMNMVDISQSLFAYDPPKGRMKILNGIKGSIIIDDSYNASPQSTIAAIEATSRLKIAIGAKRWAIIGDMLELGGFTVSGHQEVGQQIAANNFSKIVAVGERSLMIMSAALDAGFNRDCIYHFSSSIEAANFVKENICEGDLLLVKGSQGIRMEKITKELLADSDKAKDILVRQKWPDA